MEQIIQHSKHHINKCLMGTKEKTVATSMKNEEQNIKLKKKKEKKKAKCFQA